MFLFVSHARSKTVCFKRASLKKNGLSTALLMLSLTVHAESPGVSEQPASNIQSDGQTQQNPMPDARAHSLNFPRWPQYQQENNEIIPPPPPGPYKSSALSDYSVNAPVSAYHSGKHPSRRQVVHHNSAVMPMNMYSPDIPWPTDLRPERRMPDYRAPAQGYHHAAPQVMQKSPPYGLGMNKQYGNDNFGNRRTPYLNSSRWMPSMGMAPPGPYNNRWNYAPNYGSYHGPQSYGRPVINNSGAKSANPAYR